MIPLVLVNDRLLRDFLYDPELLSQDEVDERALRGPIGVLKISHTVVIGHLALWLWRLHPEKLHSPVFPALRARSLWSTRPGNPDWAVQLQPPRDRGVVAISPGKPFHQR